MVDVIRAKWLHGWVGMLLVCSGGGPACADSAGDQYTVAANHYSHGRWQSAVEEFSTYLADYPDGERAELVTFFLGESLVQLRQFDRARQQFADYLRRAPQGTYAEQARYRRGEAAFLAGDLPAARADLEQFLSAAPNDPLWAHALAYLGQLELRSGAPEVARGRFEECLRRFPAGPHADDCRFGLARALELTGDATGAIRFYEFLANNPDSELRHEAHLQLVLAHYQAGQWSAAESAAARLHRQSLPEPLAGQAAYWLGMSQFAAGQFAAAAETLSQTVDAHRQHSLAPAMAFAAGESWRRSGNLVRAASQYERVCSTWPESPWADDCQQLLIQLAWEQNEPERVEQLATAFLSAHGDSPLRAIVQQTLGRARLKRGDYEGAVTVLTELTNECHTESESPPESVSLESRPNASSATGVGRDQDMIAMSLDNATNTQIRQATEVCADPANWYYLALAWLGRQRPADALAALDRLPVPVEDGPLRAAVQVARAAALVTLQRYAEAIDPLRAYLASEPEGPDAARCRAQLAVALGSEARWGEAQQTLAQMRQLAGDDPLYLSTVLYLAEAAYQARQQRLAESLFRELATEGNPPEYVARGLSGVAWLQWEANPGSAGAAATFSQLLEQFPHSPLAAEAAMVRGQALQEQGKQEAALGMYHLVIDQYSSSEHVPAAMLAAAKLHDALQQDREAAPLLQRLRAEYPDYRPDAVAYQLGWVLYELDRAPEADALFAELSQDMVDSRFWGDATYHLAERAAKNEPDRADRLAATLLERAPAHRLAPHARYLRGQIAARQGRWADTERWMQPLTTGPETAPLHAIAQYWLAEALYRQGKYEEAGTQFDQLRTATADRTDVWLAMVALRCAQVRAQRRQWDEAFQIADGIAARFPQFPRQYEADYVLGRYHVSRAEFDQARAAYQRVLDSPTGARTETAAMAQWMIGETYFQQKQYDRAIRTYHRVESLFGYPRWQAAALLQAGKCHEMVGRWEQAMQLYAQIVDEYFQTEFAKTAAQRLRVAQQRAEIARAR